MREQERQKKVISMMISSHSILRDRYLHLSSLFENGLLLVSVILNAFVFIDSQFIEKQLGISEASQKLIIGLAAIIVFAISLVLLQVKWKEKAESHGHAADQLFALMQELKTLVDSVEVSEKNSEWANFNKKYTDVNTAIVKIPDSKFNALKLRHSRKVELSKLIDKYPGSLLIILRLRLFFSSFSAKD